MNAKMSCAALCAGASIPLMLLVPGTASANGMASATVSVVGSSIQGVVSNETSGEQCVLNVGGATVASGIVGGAGLGGVVLTSQPLAAGQYTVTINCIDGNSFGPWTATVGGGGGGAGGGSSLARANTGTVGAGIEDFITFLETGHLPS